MLRKGGYRKILRWTKIVPKKDRNLLCEALEKTMKPTPSDVEKAQKILAPLFNPEPHPFQEEWSDEHSMTSEQLITKLAQALADERNEALDSAAVEVGKFMPFPIQNTSYTVKEHDLLCETVRESERAIRALKGNP